MKILIIGNKGSQGQRFTAICKHLGHEVLGYDIDNNGSTPEHDRVIIATPTDQHMFYAMASISINNVPTLCEKPVSKNLHDIEDLIESSEKTNTPAHM